MAKYEMEIPDEQIPILFEAFCSVYDYTGLNEDGKEEGPDVFTRKQVIRFMDEVTTSYQINKAKKEAEDKARESAGLDIT